MGQPVTLTLRELPGKRAGLSDFVGFVLLFPPGAWVRARDPTKFLRQKEGSLEGVGGSGRQPGRVSLG